MESYVCATAENRCDGSLFPETRKAKNIASVQWMLEESKTYAENDEKAVVSQTEKRRWFRKKCSAGNVILKPKTIKYFVIKNWLNLGFDEYRR